MNCLESKPKQALKRTDGQRSSRHGSDVNFAMNFFRQKPNELEILDPATPEGETPLGEAGETTPDTDTSTMHFAIKSKLGWIAWKEREASLYSLFERAFAATRCELKFSDMLDEYAMEVEIPNQMVDKFTKYFNGKALALEIDKLHGLEPVLGKWKDVKLSGLKKTLGTTSSHQTIRSSIDALQQRFLNLENVNGGRNKEVEALRELTTAMKRDMTKRFHELQHRIDVKVYEKCGSKLETIETRILQTVRDELSFLGTPLPFKHPPEGYVKAHVDTRLLKHESLDFLSSPKQRSYIDVDSKDELPALPNESPYRPEMKHSRDTKSADYSRERTHSRERSADPSHGRESKSSDYIHVKERGHSRETKSADHSQHFRQQSTDSSFQKEVVSQSVQPSIQPSVKETESLSVPETERESAKATEIQPDEKEERQTERQTAEIDQPARLLEVKRTSSLKRNKIGSFSDSQRVSIQEEDKKPSESTPRPRRVSLIAPMKIQQVNAERLMSPPPRDDLSSSMHDFMMEKPRDPAETQSEKEKPVDNKTVQSKQDPDWDPVNVW